MKYIDKSIDLLMPTIDDIGIPRYLRFAQELRDQILSGTLKPGDRLPSFTEVRAQHGLSQATWDKVHSLLLSENLIVSQRGRGTFVAPEIANVPCSGLTGGAVRRSGIIGVSGHGFGLSRKSIYWAQVMDGIWSAAQAAGVQVLLMNGDEPRGWDNADGVLLLDVSAAATARRHEAELTYVSILEPLEDFSHVAADDYFGARLATQHLLELGHRRIGYMHSADDRATARRIAGYRDAVGDAGILPRSGWMRTVTGENDSGEDFVRAGRILMQQWLHEDWAAQGCTALLTQNDEVAIGAMEVLRTSGLSVPDDVSVIGFDGATTDTAASGLTTVEVPLRDIGAAALEMLLRHIENPGTAQEHRLTPVTLRMRQSTAACAVPA